MTPSDSFSPGERIELQKIITDAVTAALSAFALGRRSRGATSSSGAQGTVSPEDEWRRAASLRYAEGSWKRSLTDVVPFRQFRPNDILAVHTERLQREHPNHGHLTSAVANTLSELIRDGIIAKLGPGRYGPAIGGESIVE